MDSCGSSSRILVTASVVLASVCWPYRASAQAANTKSQPPSSISAKADVKALEELVLQLRSQLRDLNVRVETLEANKDAAAAESQRLRAEVAALKARPTDPASGPGYGAGAAMAEQLPVTTSAGAADQKGSTVPNTQQGQTLDERISQLEESLDMANSKIKEQSQTKVESGSKYRVRLNGLALFNLFANDGTVDNQDFPQIAVPPRLLDSTSSFGGSLRQSQIGLQAFGPELMGAHTAAEIRFDFAGGFPKAPNGHLTGLVRLRTGTVRFDWTNTSIVAGQDYLFFSPLTPTSYASLAIPALSYSGNLWGWTPQVRIEHRFHISDASTIRVQGGILETLSGDTPSAAYERTATWGEQSGQPGYALHVAWNHSAFGQNIVAGVGGYYGRQTWGFGRNVDGWATTADLTVPLGHFLEFAGQIYRGSAVGGLGGAIGQSVLWNGLLTDPGTEVYGLDSIGGWAQLKVKPTLKFEINGAFGSDNPFASDLRRFSQNPIYFNSLLSKNLTALANVIYRPRSDLIFSLEYKRLKTFKLDSNPNSANNINLIVGYIF